MEHALAAIKGAVIGRSADIKIVRISGLNGFAQGVHAAARVQPQQQKTVGAQVKQSAHVFNQNDALGYRQVQLVYRLLPAGGVHPREFERGNQPVRFCHVIAGQVQQALCHGRDCLAAGLVCLVRQACQRRTNKTAMLSFLCAMHFFPLSEDQLRQLIDAQACYAALEQARQSASMVHGSMFWRVDKGRDYLVRASTRARQERLGPRSSDTEGIYQRFVNRKLQVEERVDSLEAALDRHRRMNLALRVGRCPNIVQKILAQFEKQGVAEHFLTVGTHALVAFETAAGVRVMPDALATRDVDMLFDTRKRLAFFTQLAQDDVSFIKILQKTDKSFQVKDDQRYTAVNQDGFEVDVIRRQAKDVDPHPLRMSQHADDLWPVQVGSGEQMLAAGRFSQVVASNGAMARMTTIAPQAFVKLKRQLSGSASRDPLKRDKDALQARVVQTLMDDYMIELNGKPRPGDPVD